MSSPSPHAYGLLGMLAVRPWSSYDLTRQVRRSLRFMWQSSEGHLYREQAHLVRLGWATVEEESVGARRRKRYAITDAGRAALGEWLATEPEEPSFRIEGILRAFFADQGTPAQLVAALRSTASAAATMHDELLGYVEEYLAEGGALSMVEAGRSGRGAPREEFHGRPVYAERLHAVALAIDVLTQLFDTVERFADNAAAEAATWTATTDPALAPTTRRRLEAIRRRGRAAARRRRPRPAGGVESPDNG